MRKTFEIESENGNFKKVTHIELKEKRNAAKQILKSFPEENHILFTFKCIYYESFNTVKVFKTLLL